MGQGKSTSLNGVQGKRKIRDYADGGEDMFKKGRTKVVVREEKNRSRVVEAARQPR